MPALQARLYRRSPWVGWTELFRALILLLGAGRIVKPAPHVDSLPELARWISGRTNAAVTIEDRDSRVIAYAVGANDVDTIRNQTILRGAVPAWRVERLMATGFLPAVWRSDDVVVRDAEDEDPARMVIALKAENETLGTIWAALDAETDRVELRRLLLEVRQSAAAMLLREVHRELYERQLQESALADLLANGAQPGVPAALLGLRRDARYTVVALGEDDASAQSVMFHIKMSRTGTKPVRLGTELLVVVPAEEDEADEAALAVTLAAHLKRAAGAHAGPVVVGPIVGSLPELHTSATVARQILDAAALSPVPTAPGNGPAVLTAADVRDALILIQVADQLAPIADTVTAPLQALYRHDVEHGTRFVQTVAAVLAHPGNLAEAARELGIHANSLRYRLQRISAVSGIDLHSAPARLRTGLALQIFQRSAASRSPGAPPSDSEGNRPQS